MVLDPGDGARRSVAVRGRLGPLTPGDAGTLAADAGFGFRQRSSGTFETIGNNLVRGNATDVSGAINTVGIPFSVLTIVRCRGRNGNGSRATPTANARSSAYTVLVRKRLATRST